MDREGVGDALSRMRRWLRPGGVLVDVEPEAAPLRLAARIDGEAVPAGLAHDAAFFHEDLAHVADQLRGLVARGLLERRGEVEATIRLAFDTVADWDAFVKRPRAGALEVDDAVLERALDAMARGAGAMVASIDHTGRAYVRALPDRG